MSQVKERPIMFSAPMVRAILESRKTVTRRALNAQALKNIGYGVQLGECYELPREGPLHPNSIGYYTDFCPFGQPGDRLWVRETFIDLRGTGVEHRPDPDGPLQRYAYAADCRPGSHSDEARKYFGLKYKPSIHMPRAACRILLEITDVRVERLQDISRADIRAEGLHCPPELASDDVSPNYRDWYPAAWRELWESTGGDWNTNPWVWVVEFKRVTP